MPPLQQRTTLYYAHDPSIRPFSPFEHPAFGPVSPGFENSGFSVVIESDFVARLVYTYETLALPLRSAPNAQMTSRDRKKLLKIYLVDAPRVACRLYQPAIAMLDAFFEKELPFEDDGRGDNKNTLGWRGLGPLSIEVWSKLNSEGKLLERSQELALIAVLAKVVCEWEIAECTYLIPPF